MKRKANVGKVVVKESAKSITRSKDTDAGVRMKNRVQTASGWRRSMERGKE